MEAEHLTFQVTKALSITKWGISYCENLLPWIPYSYMPQFPSLQILYATSNVSLKKAWKCSVYNMLHVYEHLPSYYSQNWQVVNIK